MDDASARLVKTKVQERGAQLLVGRLINLNLVAFRYSAGIQINSKAVNAALNSIHKLTTTWQWMQTLRAHTPTCVAFFIFQ